MPTKRSTTQRKTSTTKRTSAKKVAAKTATANKVAAKKTVATTTKKTTANKKATARRTSTGRASARRGDLIVVDSTRVGSPPREGEIVKVMTGDMSVSYEVRWGDGHRSVITPAAGTAHIVSK